MPELNLHLENLSVAELRAGEPLRLSQILGAGDAFTPGELSFPKFGLKVQFGGDEGKEIVSYVYLFFVEGERDWLRRLNHKDEYGATFSAFRGNIYFGGSNQTDEFLRDPRAFLLACPAFHLLRESTSAISFVLTGDPRERRIHIEYAGTRTVRRIILG